MNRILILSVFAIAAVSSAACGNDPEPTVTPTAVPSPSPTAEPIAQPFTFPYIFSGQFTVAGEPGPQGVPIFARLGSGRGSFNNAIREGEYGGVLIAPESPDDIGKLITFHLGLPEGETVQAAETLIFNPPAQPEFFELDLSFPRLP